jgi:hypothetical protein
MSYKRSTKPPSAAQTSRTATPDSRLEFDAIVSLAHSLNELQRQSASICAPMVQGIIQSRTQDQQHIERLLDRLLDCACIPDGLVLFRALCRYYFSINPVATADYIQAYREMWDSEEAGKEEPQ